MSVPEPEKLIGIEVYATVSSGIGGVIRSSVEDFVVKELLVDGSKADVSQHEGKVLGSSSIKNRYSICVLSKRDWDTLLAISTIARQLGITTRQIQIAGIKDAKAVTAQYVTIENLTLEAIEKVQIKDIKISPIGYLRHPISSYYLLGNQFNIVIRTIDHSKSTITKRVTRTIDELRKMGGIPNFFGHQRFGSKRPITHSVGKALVQGDFREAAMIYLGMPSPHEHPDSRQARKWLQKTQDFKQASRYFPKKLHYERLMLNHLARKPGDFIGAFRSLPAKLGELFPQAYQAYLYNKSLSRRIKKELLLNRAEVGDYVIRVERSKLPMPRMHEITSQTTISKINKSIQAGKMRLAIPLIGFKQGLSKGVQGEIEKEILEEENISPECFKIQAMPEVSARGVLRTVLAPVDALSFEKTSGDIVNPSKREAKVNFLLQRGSYATILLREIMKPRNPIRAGF